MQELFHDEQTQSVSATAVSGQSQTRSAQYARNYRKNPEKNRKINEDRRRNYKMKKEGINNVSSMFESAALPSKAEQQTIEKALKLSDKASLPKLQGEASGELSDSSQSYCHEDQRSVVTRRSENVFEEKTNNLDIQNQAELLLEIRDCLVDLRETGKAKKSCRDNGFDDNVNKGMSNFLSGFFRQLSQIDGAAFVRNFPAALVLGFCAYYACLFVAEQTVPLYESLQFPNPQMACYGAIGIAVGFSALSAISETEIVKLFTAVIIAYEVLIVWSGSQANQKKLSSQALRSNPTHFSISETYGIAKTDYEQKKTRYEDKNSEVYHNGWFKINHLDPAKLKMDEASAKLVAVESELGEKYQTDWIHLVLKALYRLSAVALVMLLAKETIKRGLWAFSFCH